MRVPVNGRYEVRLVAKNEGVKYVDENDVYRFNVALKDGKWRVYLPGSKGKDYRRHELTPEERKVVLARIKEYLESRRYFWLIGPTYHVVFEDAGPLGYGQPG